MATDSYYDGDEWQACIVGCLKLRYGAGDFVEVPDRVKGDSGLEGFSRDGKGFQCYVPEDSDLTVAQRSQKLKAKITADLAKLQKNAETLRGLLGPTVLQRWILATPRCDDKAVQIHAERKAAEIRSAGLEFIAPDFTASIETLANFVTEHGKLLEAGKSQLKLNAPLATPEQTEDWASSNNVLVENLTRKISAIQADTSRAQSLRDRMLNHFVTGQNALERLRTQSPSLHEHAMQTKQDWEEFLATRTLIPGAVSSTLNAAIDDFTAQLKLALPGLADHSINQLAYSAVSDWLLRCPLDPLP